ncbi:hypothetical protein H9Q13_12025 [Pontibacter sp. JH31]|uniref:Glycosyltransferase RgtA/B/C/D-like domain-containing protein n=1 Tax=Pontibacter aquaedesilientis TaxID=2766980 RepID=A0ABR7XHZ6_9BACT|nr:hypothetical protein [Pontibacter aquaedesilientis]MBD1397895.1 hypothetical protein [Pontibacter aquaedesilientis]
MSILINSLNLLALAGLVWWLWKQDWEKPIRAYFFPALLLKLGCGLLLGILSFHVFDKGDTQLYYKRALLMTELAHEQGMGTYLRYLLLNDPTDTSLAALQRPFYESAWNMPRLLSIPMLLTNGNYYISSLYLSLFSFTGLWVLVNAISRYFPATTWAALIGFIFFPSVLYWGAGVTKESFMMGGMGLVLGSFMHLLNTADKKRILLYFTLFLLGLYLVWLVKYFVAVALVLTLVLCLLLKAVFYTRRLAHLHWLPKLLGLTILFSGIAYLGTQLNPNLHLENLPDVVYRNYQTSLLASQGKPRIDFPFLEPTYLSFALHSQLAFIGMLFRPFIWEIYSLRTLAAALENTVLLLLVFGFLRDLFSESRWKWRHGYLLIAVLVFVFVMGTLLAYSMPNLGTLSRYRVVVLPFVVHLLFMCRTNQALLAQLFPRNEFQTAAD